MSDIAKAKSAFMPRPEIAPDVKRTNQKVMGAAKMYEKLFMREMYKAMRKSVSKSNLLPTNMGERIYREQLDDKYIDLWSQKGGTGFANTIYDHIMERFGNMFGQQRQSVPSGPLPINNDSKMYKIKKLPAPDGSLTYHFQRSNKGGATAPLSSPWAGTVSAVQGLEGDRVAMRVRHNNGLSSTLVFSGVPAVKSVGAQVKAGQKLATLSPSGSELHWNVKKNGV